MKTKIKFPVIAVMLLMNLTLTAQTLSWSVLGGLTTKPHSSIPETSVQDNSGNTYLLGAIGISPVQLTTITKYAPGGTYLASTTISNTTTSPSVTGGDYGIKILLDGSGNVIVLHRYNRGGTLCNIAISKYNPGLTATIFPTVFITGFGASLGWPVDMELDNAGNIVVLSGMGLYFGAVGAILPTWRIHRVTTAGLIDLLWILPTTSPYAPKGGTPYDLALDAAGNMYACGGSYESISSTREKFTVVRVNAAGGMQWFNRHGITAADDYYASSLLVDKINQLIVTGTGLDGSNKVILTNSYNRYSGIVNWTRSQYPPISNSVALPKLTMDGNGFLYLGVSAERIVSTGYSARNIYVMKYSAAGSLLLSFYNYAAPASGQHITFIDIEVSAIGNSIYVLGILTAANNNGISRLMGFNGSTGVQFFSDEHVPFDGYPPDNLRYDYFSDIVLNRTNGEIFVTGSHEVYVWPFPGSEPTVITSSHIHKYIGAPLRKASGYEDGSWSSRESSSEMLNIFPNPAFDFISIEGFKKSLNVVLTDAAGRIVLEQKINEGEKIPVSDLPRGTYFIMLSSGEKNVKSKKILLK